MSAVKSRIFYEFNSFYLADPLGIDKNHFGIGLTIAKELITLHNDRITVSDPPEGGDGCKKGNYAFVSLEISLSELLALTKT